MNPFDPFFGHQVDPPQDPGTVFGHDPGDEQEHVDNQPKKKVFKLNGDQQKCFDWLIDMIPQRNPPMRIVLLEGPAGTGKTFLMNRVIEALMLKDSGLNVGMTAPTHKAVRQLKRHSELKDRLEFGTIHSFLKLVEKQVPNPLNKKEMIIVYEPDFDNKYVERKIDQMNVLIVDESSMLGDKLFEYIEDAYRSKPLLKVIFMGDGVQIPPVREKGAKVVQRNAIPFVPEQRQTRKIHHLKLEEIVRQGAGNPIIEYATGIRLNYRNVNIPQNFSHTEDTGVEVLRKEDGIDPLRALFVKYFDTDEFRQNPDYIKIVAWRNKTVDYFNNEVRKVLHKEEELPKIIAGDDLIMNKPFLNGDKVLLANNTELKVLSAEVINYALRYKLIERNKSHFDQATDDESGEKSCVQELKVYSTEVMDEYGKIYKVMILHEDSQEVYDSIQSSMVNAAHQGDGYDRKTMWREFYAMPKKFAWVNHNYCLTAHKAQGSTYDYCISMEWDIDQGFDVEERNRIRYVAATRAKNKLFIVK